MNAYSLPYLCKKLVNGATLTTEPEPPCLSHTSTLWNVKTGQSNLWRSLKQPRVSKNCLQT